MIIIKCLKANAMKIESPKQVFPMTTHSLHTFPNKNRLTLVFPQTQGNVLKAKNHGIYLTVGFLVERGNQFCKGLSRNFLWKKQNRKSYLK
jgi:hypothetical protein